MPSRSTRDARRRALGQDFLVDDRAIAAVVGTVHPPPGALVLDLGAGAGALTAALAARGARVVAVERDPAWLLRLRREAPRWGDVAVRDADLLHVAFPAEAHLVVSSPPWSAATAVVRRLLGDGHGLVRAALVLQREAARRLAGRPRTGRFAAGWAPWFELRVTAHVGREAFRPVPAADAAVLLLAPRAVPLLSPAAWPAYAAFLDAVFAGRGRTVVDRMAPRAGRRAALRAAEEAGVARDAVPSAVPPEAYAALFLAARAGVLRR